MTSQSIHQKGKPIFHPIYNTPETYAYLKNFLDCNVNPICCLSKCANTNDWNLDWISLLRVWVITQLTWSLLSWYSKMYFKYCSVIFLVEVYMETLYKRDLLGKQCEWETLLSRLDANSLILETFGSYPHCGCLDLWLGGCIYIMHWKYAF